MNTLTFDPSRFKRPARAGSQYQRQLVRLAAEGKEIECIEHAVDGALINLSSARRASFVIYGEPQSGKTEMMICLTARLLDEGRLFILHLLNDSVDLLGQNLGRFQKSGLAPAAKNFTDIRNALERLLDEAGIHERERADGHSPYWSGGYRSRAIGLRTRVRSLLRGVWRERERYLVAEVSKMSGRPAGAPVRKHFGLNPIASDHRSLRVTPLQP